MLPEELPQMQGSRCNPSGYNRTMDEVIADILETLRGGGLDAAALDRILRDASRRQGGSKRLAKKHILPYYLDARARQSDEWKSWAITPRLEERFIAALQMKPRRTASGVATITVITKPQPCAGRCIFCPNDVRMPKSYLHNEPACQRAERNYFDPYLQTAARLQALQAMGHETGKVELIVLGGSWTDYDALYRLWFICELFACLNDSDEQRSRTVRERTARYGEAGLTADPEAIRSLSCCQQQAVTEGRQSYNGAVAALYGPGSPWEEIAAHQAAGTDRLEAVQAANEKAAHRMVGLVVETRPDAIDPGTLAELRHLGCTKVQLGIQSLDASILEANGRPLPIDDIARTLGLCRLFGFKTHVHFMVNLLGAEPETDKAGFRQLVEDRRFKPDEVKLYPCALVEGTELMDCYREGRWRPYTETELIDVLADAMRTAPPFLRVSRMIRDISSDDIVAGNKKTNLRQMVEAALAGFDDPIQEIRFRELSTGTLEPDSLTLDEVTYRTAETREHFLQWVTPEGRIAGFLRLSLPLPESLGEWDGKLPVGSGEAMIREVHIYGIATKLDQEGTSAQHRGLGRRLIEKACTIAAQAGCSAVNVISAVGTREYYRKLGFRDNGLYQQRLLNEPEAGAPR